MGIHYARNNEAFNAHLIGIGCKQVVVILHSFSASRRLGGDLCSMLRIRKCFRAERTAVKLAGPGLPSLRSVRPWPPTKTPRDSREDDAVCFRHSIPGLFAVLLLSTAAFAAAPQPAERPNIVLIMADDMGFSDLGCYGSEIDTPNIDGLAAGGMRFTQFYNTARCCPTRAALMTGLYSHQAGVGHMVNDLGDPAYQGYLNDRCVTIAEVMRPAGYRTLMTGKWHVGEEPPHWPVKRGYDRYFGIVSGGSNYFRLDPGRIMARDDQRYEPPAEGFYMTDAFSDAAVEFIEEYGGRPEPFFLYVAYTSPHWPLHAWPEDIAKYRDKYTGGWDRLRRARHARLIEEGLVKPSWPLTPRDERVPAWEDAENKDDWALRMAVYAAQIDRMDQGIGRILAAIRKSKKEENTLVMFLCDNGGCAEKIDRGKPGAPAGTADSFLSYGVGWANASNTPFRLYKHWVHEGGISTPLVARWPAVIQGGQTVSEIGHVIDIMATCADAGDAEYPQTYGDREITPLEGKSLVPTFRGQQRDGHEAVFWEHEGNRAVRQGKWKLVSRFPGKWELYDLEADRTEMNDLAKSEPETAARMAQAYEEWSDRAGVRPWNEVRRRRN